MNTETKLSNIDTVLAQADNQDDQLAIDAIDWSVAEIDFEERINFETRGGSGTGSYC